MNDTCEIVKGRRPRDLQNALNGSEGLSRARAKALVQALLEFPPLQFILDLGKGSATYRRFLNRALPSSVKNRGVYESFEDARRHAPRSVRLGYDHAEIARGYQHQGFLLSDYPAAVWLREVFQDSRSIFDLGGSVGILFYLMEEFLDYPHNLEWTVCEVPAVVDAGRQLARERAESRLRFTSNMHDADGAECLLASGSLQYIEQPVADLLRGLRRPPRHLIINRIPLHPTRDCITLQNIRWAVSPYRIFQRDRFIRDLEALGYVLIDAWRVIDHSCWIPLYPEHSVSEYSGLYLQKPER